MSSHRCLIGIDQTYIEEAKEAVKILLPSGNLVPSDLPERQWGGDSPFALLNDIALDLGKGSAIETSVSWWMCAHCWSDSRNQILNRVEGGLAELIQSFPFRSLVERLTSISANGPKHAQLQMAVNLPTPLV